MITPTPMSLQPTAGAASAPVALPARTTAETARRKPVRAVAAGPAVAEPARPYRARHAVAGVVGVGAGCIVLTAVVVLFDDASSMPWLPGTPDNVAAMQRCDAVRGSAARRACAERVVAGVLTRQAAVRLAAADAASGAAR